MNKTGDTTTVTVTPNTADDRLRFWWGLLLRLVVAAAGVYIFWRVRTILATVILSLVLSCAATPIVEWLCQKRIMGLKPHTQRTLATFVAFLLIFAGIFLTVRALISPFQVEYKKLMTNLPQINEQIQTHILQFRTWYEGLDPEVRGWVDKAIAETSHDGGDSFSPQKWGAEVVKHAAKAASHLVELFLLPVLAFYFTLDGKTLRNQFICLIPRRHHRQTIALISESSAIMRAYIISQFWLAVIAGVFTWGILALLGMDYAVILGLFAGITRAIPVIGPFMGGVPVTLLAFLFGVQTGNPYLWIWVTLGFGAMHVFESKILMPQFLGHALNLHAAVILVALLIGGEFFGLMGMFLAAPVAAFLRLIIIHYFILPKRRANHQPPPKNGKNGHGVRLSSLERAVRHGAVVPATVSASTPVTAPTPSLAAEATQSPSQTA